jgi:hypothetical protein
MHRIHNDLDSDSMDIFMMKVWYNKHSAYVERPNPPLSKKRPHFEIFPRPVNVVTEVGRLCIRDKGACSTK